MPTQTFMKLPSEKKQRIFSAIYTELQRVSYTEMSINQIIKTAGIPRGSFYQYFENKEDAFNWFLDRISEDLKNYISEKILSVHGDIFEITESLFETFAEDGPGFLGPDVIKHTIPYVDITKISPFTKYISGFSREKRFQMFSALGIGNLKAKSEEEILDIISIIGAVFYSMIPSVYTHPENKNEICESFNRKLAIIKRAVT